VQQGLDSLPELSFPPLVFGFVHQLVWRLHVYFVNLILLRGSMVRFFFFIDGGSDRMLMQEHFPFFQAAHAAFVLELK